MMCQQELCEVPPFFVASCYMSHLPVGGIRFEIGKEKKLFFLVVILWGENNWV